MTHVRLHLVVPDSGSLGWIKLANTVDMIRHSVQKDVALRVRF